MKRLSLPLLAFVVLAAAVALTACGSNASSSGASVDELLADTFGGKGKAVKSGRLDVGLKLDAKGLQNVNGPLGLRLSGPFQSNGAGVLPTFDFNVAIDAGGQNITAGAVSTGSAGFLRFQDQAYKLGDDLYKQFKTGYADQAKCGADKGASGVTFKTLGIDPRTWLKNPRKNGTEDVGGAQTVHITSSVDVPRLLDDVNTVLGRTDLQQQQQDPCRKNSSATPNKKATRQLSAADKQAIAAAVQTARVDIWTGDADRILRRINVTMNFDVPAAQRRKVSGLQSGTLSFDLTIGALNEKQQIKTPTGAKPLDALTSQLGGQVPGLGGSSGASGSSGANGSSGSNNSSGSSGASGSGSTGTSGVGGSKYQQCVQSAGNDVTKLQGCADLIGQ